MFSLLKKTQPQKGSQIIFKVDGMHCTSCVMNIDGSLEDLDGVYSSTTSYKSSKTTIQYDSKKVNESQLKNIIKEAGYKAEKL